MGVTLDVLEGRRPTIPADCPKPMAKLLSKCWRNCADKRPPMETVLSALDLLSTEPTDMEDRHDQPNDSRSSDD